MREVKFRGRRKDNGKWVYGCLRECFTASSCYKEKGPDISWFVDDDTLHEVEVDPKTVGQFTGLKDKNGKEIYEGDILHIWSKFYKKDMPKAIVFWSTTNAKFDIKEPAGQYHNWLVNCHKQGWFHEVIGSIHENPELLK